MKTCVKCNIEKEVSDFYPHKTNKTGFSSRCKECIKSKVKEYQNNNKDIILEKNKTKYKSNKSEYKKRNKENYLKNKELRKEKQRIYNSKNKNKRKVYNQIDKVKKRDNEYMKQYSRSTPEKHLATNIKCSISMRLREINSKKDQSTLEIIGLNSWEEFKQHIESQFINGMNWGNYGNKIETDWSIDHIIPISTATTLEEVKKLNHYTNLRPMWHLDNIKKRDKISH